MKAAYKTAVAAYILCITLLCVSMAEGAPASQYGFSGWPYRSTAPCARRTEAPKRTEAPAASPAPTKAPEVSADVGDYTTLSISAQEYSAWNLLNEDRRANGLPDLPLDETLCAIARVKSCDMKTNRYFSHTSPTFGKAKDMLKAFGYSFKGVGENIAHHATVEKSEAAFMSSVGHRANILGSQWTRVGIGICLDDQGYVYMTQIFAR